MFTNSIAFSYDFNQIRTIYFDCIVKKIIVFKCFYGKKRILFFNIFNMVLFLMFRYVTHFLGKWHPIPWRFSPVNGSQSIESNTHCQFEWQLKTITQIKRNRIKWVSRPIKQLLGHFGPSWREINIHSIPLRDRFSILFLHAWMIDSWQTEPPG